VSRPKITRARPQLGAGIAGQEDLNVSALGDIIVIHRSRWFRITRHRFVIWRHRRIDSTQPVIGKIVGRQHRISRRMTENVIDGIKRSGVNSIRMSTAIMIRFVWLLALAFPQHTPRQSSHLVSPSVPGNWSRKGSGEGQGIKKTP
jgi:hypothetical protein